MRWRCKSDFATKTRITCTRTLTDTFYLISLIRKEVAVRNDVTSRQFETRYHEYSEYPS